MTEHFHNLLTFRNSCSSLVPKYLQTGFLGITNSNKEYLGELFISGQGGDEQSISYYYFSKAGKITCNHKEEYEDDGIVHEYNSIYNINAKAGWNKIYIISRHNGEEITTNNILTKEMKWLYYNEEERN